MQNFVKDGKVILGHVQCSSLPTMKEAWKKTIIKICLILWQRVAVATRDYYVCIIIAIFLLPPFLRRRSSLCIFWRNSHRHTVNFLLIHWHGLRQNCSHSQNWYKLRKKPLFEMHIDKFVTCIGTRTIAGRLNCNPNGICREMQIQFR